MKPFDKLNYVDRAKMLHEFFPDEIPNFIGVADAILRVIIEQPEKAKSEWQNEILPFDLCEPNAAKCKQILDKYGAKLHKSSRLFADQLFDGNIGLVIIYFLHQYKIVADNRYLSAAIDLFFPYQ